VESSLLAVLSLFDLLFFDKCGLFGNSLPDWGRSTLSESSRHDGVEILLGIYRERRELIYRTTPGFYI